MFCQACGSQIPDNSKFCPSCGAALPQQQNIAPPAPAQAVSPPPTKKRLNKTLLISLGAGLLVCIVIFAIVFIGKTAKYKEAVSLMESGKTQQALESFAALKNYRDSEVYAAECQNQITYEQAKALKTSGQFTEAAAMFAGLGTFEDASEQAEDCRNCDAYEAAISLKDSNQLEQAYKAFVQLGGFRDAADLAAKCKAQLDYDSAYALMEAGQYQQAMAAFVSLGVYQDSASLAEQCNNHLNYASAEAALSEGKFYTAYELFSAMPNFLDSRNRAQLCIQETPQTGEQYRNSDYSKKTCPIKIKTPDDGLCTYLKFYTESNDLVSCIFIESGKTAKVSLPAGNYQIKQATGKTWFGETEMFGEQNASYYVMTFGSGATITSLERNYIYTLTLRNASDGNIGMDSVDPGSF